MQIEKHKLQKYLQLMHQRIRHKCRVQNLAVALFQFDHYKLRLMKEEKKIQTAGNYAHHF